MSEHISSQFNQELETVRTQVMKMGGLIEQQLQQVMHGLETGQIAILEEVSAADAQVNAMEVSIDDQCQLIIARRQPAAGDLRLVLTVTRIITDLERMGDEIKKIALYGRDLLAKHGVLPHQFQDLQRLAQRSLGMVHSALDAFARLDATVVVALSKEDIVLDREYDNLLRQQITYMMEDPRTIGTSLDLLFMFKAIERIGDHALNVSEHVVYLAKGIDIRHSSIEQVKKVSGAVDE
ncbi:MULTISPECIES: phosphate signaling complex protein PhoU [Vitreoscilla]|uniref:Phosphate-specific transport system accessory protein PhoU n=1 Tax=Vitreoscilla stercoraria TaxID=61 RepID=A0ABY4E6R2_VITST|nr:MULTISPECIES: phosphate signaling complex protein PhoU [Vitreoscilla]AUZ04889.1 phosphate-specific transport system regulatory protein PhoU [Vitreoscilla sp. C1]UOO91456.1 phosphate signaling complex protein PhoU [Vitreoscilla stercoraria]